MLLRDDGYCFACGRNNDKGLHLKFESNPDQSITAFFTPERTHQGYQGVLHGGIISTLLDEVMAQALIAQGILAVTAKIEVRFRKPAPLGSLLAATGRVGEKKGRLCSATAELTGEDGTVYATANSVFSLVKPEK